MTLQNSLSFIAPTLPIQVAVMSADQTHTQSSVVLENVTDLVVPVSANTRYYFTVNLRLTSPANADIDTTFAAIANTDFASYFRGYSLNNPTAFATEERSTTDGTEEYLQFWGFFKTGSTGGNLQFQFAQGSEQASDTIIHEASNLIVYTQS